MKTSFAVTLLATVALSGCYAIPVSPNAFNPSTVKLTAIGYGSAGTYERTTEGQKKLMAMRTSKLDAYRAMAEQVNGVRVSGGSTVGAMMLQNDNYRVSVDAYVRGARVTNIAQMADGNYETTIEMDFDESIVSSFGMRVPVRGVVVPTYNQPYFRGTVGSDYSYNSRPFSPIYGQSYYYAE